MTAPAILRGMDAPALAAAIRRYGAATDPRTCAALADEIRREWPDDPEAQRLVRVIERKARRLAREN